MNVAFTGGRDSTTQERIDRHATRILRFRPVAWCRPRCASQGFGEDRSKVGDRVERPISSTRRSLRWRMRFVWSTYYVMVGDRPGEGARVLNQLRTRASPHGAARLSRRASRQSTWSRSTAGRSRARRRAGWKVVGPKKAFLIQGSDRVGALVGAFDRLAASNVNVTATDAVTAGGRRFGSLLWVKQSDVARAKKALGAR